MPGQNLVDPMWFATGRNLRAGDFIANVGNRFTINVAGWGTSDDFAAVVDAVAACDDLNRHVAATGLSDDATVLEHHGKITRVFQTPALGRVFWQLHAKAKKLEQILFFGREIDRFIVTGKNEGTANRLAVIVHPCFLCWLALAVEYGAEFTVCLKAAVGTLVAVFIVERGTFFAILPMADANAMLDTVLAGSKLNLAIKGVAGSGAEQAGSQQEQFFHGQVSHKY